MSRNFLAWLFLFCFLLSPAFSVPYSVEEFTKYDTNLKIVDDGRIEVSKFASIRNIHDVGIIPGQVEFKLYHGGDNSFKISNYRATDRYGNEIPLKVVETSEFTSLILNIFNPILPGFEYQINLKYSIDYDDSGIFFKRVEIPLRDETSIPILDGEVVVEIPEGKFFTFINIKDAKINENSAVIKLDKDSSGNLVFEYSFIPISFSGVSGSLIFWVLVNLILIIILVLEVRKEIKRIKKS